MLPVKSVWGDALQCFSHAPGFNVMAVLERLVTIWDTYLPQFDRLGISPSELEQWQQTNLFVESAWYRNVPLDLTFTAAGYGCRTGSRHVHSAGLVRLLARRGSQGEGFRTEKHLIRCW